METKDIIRQMLDLQENPDRFSEEQLDQMLENDAFSDLLEHAAMTKRAFLHNELTDGDTVNSEKHSEQERIIDEEWRKFEQSHFAVNEKNMNIVRMKRMPKIAATIIGFLVVSCIVLAAVFTLRNMSGGKQENQIVQSADKAEDKIIKTEVASEPTDTLAVARQVVFDNVSLSEMLNQIADYYNLEVEFENQSSSQLRFYFVWERDEGAQKTVERLSNFESLDIVLENRKLIVR